MAYALHHATLQTPVGMILLEGDERALSAVHILSDGEATPAATAPSNSPVMIAARQLLEYFAGTRQRFDVPLAPLASPRGEALRHGMAAIPYGHSMSYGALAKLLDSAPRAVGQACRRNPFPIIIPCHRVHSSAGPEYYSGGNGITTKAWLVDFEHRTLPAATRTRLL